MKVSKKFRMVLSFLTGIALISVAVVAIQGNNLPPSEGPASAMVASDEAETGCSGDCATCTHAQTTPCPPDAVADSQASAAAVDADRCIGCVRCVNVAPEAFRMNPETRKAEIIAGASAEDIARGAQACPVDAINQ
jgi:ferredoxin